MNIGKLTVICQTVPKGAIVIGTLAGSNTSFYLGKNVHLSLFTIPTTPVQFLRKGTKSASPVPMKISSLAYICPQNIDRTPFKNKKIGSPEHWTIIVIFKTA